MLDLGPVRHLTRPEAARAIGVDPRTLRGWADSGAVALCGADRSKGAWSRFPPVDVLRLAVLGHLLRFGFTMAEAGQVIAGHVDPQLASVRASVADVPWHLLRNQLLCLVLTISREPHGLAVSAHSLRGERPAWHRAATLAVNVGAILHDVQDRATARGGRRA